MRSYTLSDELKADPRLAAAVAALGPSLDRIVGPRFAPQVDAAWRVAPGGVALRLSEDLWPEGVEQVIPSRDLEPGPDADDRLRWVWIELLGPGTRIIVDKLVAEAELIDG